MSRGMSSQMGNWVEVSPAPIIKPRRRRNYSTIPKLETIFEESYYYGGGEFSDSSDDKINNLVEVNAPETVVYVLPFLVAVGTYFFVLRNICA